MLKSSLNFSLHTPAQVLNRTRFTNKFNIFQILTPICLANGPWHEDCDNCSGLRRIGEAAKLAAVDPPKGVTHGFRQDFTTASLAGKRRAHAWFGTRHAFRTR